MNTSQATIIHILKYVCIDNSARLAIKTGLLPEGWINSNSEFLFCNRSTPFTVHVTRHMFFTIFISVSIMDREFTIYMKVQSFFNNLTMADIRHPIGVDDHYRINHDNFRNSSIQSFKIGEVSKLNTEHVVLSLEVENFKYNGKMLNIASEFINTPEQREVPAWQSSSGNYI